METRILLAIEERGAFAEGQPFGETGAYEYLVGRAQVAVDPDDPAQSGVVDLDKAPRNAEGRVECAGDVCMLTPAEPAKGNGRLLFDFGNRGHKRVLQFFNDAPHTNRPRTATDAGNGFLMRRGYTLVWAAWQGDLLPGEGRMVLDVPVASDGGRPITGLVRAEFLVDRPGIQSLPLSADVATRCYPAAVPDPTQASFSRRQYAWEERVPIPARDWQFARVERHESDSWAVVPSTGHVYVPDGFQPGWIYELVYRGRDPLVLGLGYVVVREVISFLKYGDRDSAGTQNPLRQGKRGVDKAYCWGRSQAGRAIRDFIYRGFNQDERGRRVFDAAFAHVAGAGRMWLQHRFAQPSRLAGQQHEDHLNYADRFPFSYATCTDHLTGRTDAIMKRPETDPLLIHTQTSSEYWQRRGSLVHTDTRGNDLCLPENVRLYHWASSQHWVDPLGEAPTRRIAQYLVNGLSTSPLFRMLLDHLDRWATDGTVPPPSRMPTRADGTLLSPDEWRSRFPSIPGVLAPRAANPLPLCDYGPDAEAGYITVEPPREPVDGREYPVLVPAVDRDGNEVSGVRMPLVQAPLGTYTGWNLRRRGVGPGAMAELHGSYFPFPETRAEREATGDPRLSLEERYGALGAHRDALVGAVRRLVAEGFLLEEDAGRIMTAARDAIAWDVDAGPTRRSA